MDYKHISSFSWDIYTILAIYPFVQGWKREHCHPDKAHYLYSTYWNRHRFKILVNRPHLLFVALAALSLPFQKQSAVRHPYPPPPVKICNLLWQQMNYKYISSLSWDIYIISPIYPFVHGWKREQCHPDKAYYPYSTYWNRHRFKILVNRPPILFVALCCAV